MEESLLSLQHWTVDGPSVTGLDRYLFLIVHYPPQRYGQLGQLIAKTSQGNPRNEKIFIAAAINDQNGDLVKGFWGSNLVSLIGILRPENCFVSLYVNGRPEAHQAWNTLADTLD